MGLVLVLGVGVGVISVRCGLYYSLGDLTLDDFMF